MLFTPLLCPMHWPNDHITNLTMISVTWDVTITSCNCNTLKIYSSLKSQLHVRISSQSFIFHLRSITVQYNASFFIIFLPASFLQWFLLFLCFMDIRCHHHVDFRSRGTSTIHYNSSLDLINNIFCSFWSWNNNFAILWSCVLSVIIIRNLAECFKMIPRHCIALTRTWGNLDWYQDMWPRWESAKIFVNINYLFNNLM